MLQLILVFIHHCSVTRLQLVQCLTLTLTLTWTLTLTLTSILAYMIISSIIEMVLDRISAYAEAIDQSAISLQQQYVACSLAMEARLACGSPTPRMIQGASVCSVFSSYHWARWWCAHNK